MERIVCDILVIGAGPAGSTAARVAAQAGARVLLVERKARVGVPEQCAGYVAQAIRWHVDLPPWCVAQAVGRLRTHLPDGSAHEVEMPGYLLDRAALDRHLALQAVRAGARLLTRTYARSTRGLKDGRKAGVGEAHEPPLQARSMFRPGFQEPGQLQRQEPELVLQREGTETAVDAGVIIGADGPHSTVARLVGLVPGPMARAVQYEMVLPHELDTAEVFFRPAFRGGYAWLFPAGRTARIGAAFDAGCEDGIAALRRLKDELVEEGKILDSAISYAGGPVPVGGPRSVRHGNVLLVGDAAGHTHPLTGAGIVNAIIAGEMAGRAAARAVLDGDETALEEYGEEFQTVLAPALERAKEKRTRLEEAWILPPAGLSSAIRGNWIAFDEYYR